MFTRLVFTFHESDYLFFSSIHGNDIVISIAMAHNIMAIHGKGHISDPILHSLHFGDSKFM